MRERDLSSGIRWIVGWNVARARARVGFQVDERYFVSVTKRLRRCAVIERYLTPDEYLGFSRMRRENGNDVASDRDSRAYNVTLVR